MLSCCHYGVQGYCPCNFPSAEAVHPYILLQPYTFVYEEVDGEAKNGGEHEAHRADLGQGRSDRDEVQNSIARMQATSTDSV